MSMPPAVIARSPRERTVPCVWLAVIPAHGVFR